MRACSASSSFSEETSISMGWSSSTVIEGAICGSVKYGVCIGSGKLADELPSGQGMVGIGD